MLDRGLLLFLFTILYGPLVALLITHPELLALVLLVLGVLLSLALVAALYVSGRNRGA